MKKTIKTVLMLSLAVLMLIVAGCDDEKKVVDTPKPQVKKEVAVKVYYPDRNGDGLHAVVKKVPEENKYKAAVDELIKGTTDKDLMGIFPPGTKVRSLEVKEGRAYVDLSREIVDNYPGGAMVEQMIIGSLVNTLTEFPEIKTVKITVVGKDTVILSNMDLEDPFERMGDLIVKK